MEPGGSHGLQNRSRPDHVGLGGFDSHALPPLVMPSFQIGRMHFNRSVVRGLAIVLLGVAVATPMAAQRVDTTRAVPVATDSLRPPIGPRRAFLYSFLAPGYSQTILGR